MMKVRVDRPAPNVFYVEEGYTVSYNEDVLEVLNEDDETIAVFRDWVYAMPTEDYDEGVGEEAIAEEVLDLAGVETVEADFLPDLASVSSAHANSHGDHEVPVDGTEGPAS